MSRFILRYTGAGKISADDVQSCQALPNCRIVDETSRMLLVEADEQPLQEFVKARKDWKLIPENTSLRVPDPRPKVKKPPLDQ
jgi:hypothetical protein